MRSLNRFVPPKYCRESIVCVSLSPETTALVYLFNSLDCRLNSSHFEGKKCILVLLFHTSIFRHGHKLDVKGVTIGASPRFCGSFRRISRKTRNDASIYTRLAHSRLRIILASTKLCKTSARSRRHSNLWHRKLDCNENSANCSNNDQPILLNAVRVIIPAYARHDR